MFRNRFACLLLAAMALMAAVGVGQVAPAAKTQVVMLGTGTPYADPDRFGPATAIVVNGTPYLVDCGPGVVRRIAQAHKNGVEGLTPQRVGVLFLTHLHSDHTVGYPDIILSPAVIGRPGALEVYGPKGLNEMTGYILKAWQKDIDIRLHGLEEGNAKAYVVHPHEIEAGCGLQGRERDGDRVSGEAWNVGRVLGVSLRHAGQERCDLW